MRKWKCIRTDYEMLTIGKVYETDDDGFGLLNDKGEPHAELTKIMDFEFSKFEEVFALDNFTKSDLIE